jgi:AcrR family transcriptional regulator
MRSSKVVQRLEPVEELDDDGRGDRDNLARGSDDDRVRRRGVDVRASYTGGGIFPRSGISLVYMESGKTRLMEAARSLLAEHPEREPSTRELYEAAGVAAPTLYHHFGTKDGLLEAVVDEAFSAYLARKRAVPRTGDLLIDFAAGWDMHVGFGVENPVLYALMYGGLKGRQSRAARTAEAELRRGLEQLADAGLLRVGVEEAIGVTTAMAIGCVTQLIHGGGSATDPMASSMRAALMSELTGHSPELGDADQAARLLLARLGSASGLFTPAEEALLCQWLRTLAEHFQPMHSDVDRDVATAELRQDTSEEGREK